MAEGEGVAEPGMSRPIPAPPVSVETKPFWDAAGEGRFLIGRCADCGRAYWYPRRICPHCLSGRTEFEESAGEGEVYTYSIMRRGPSGPYGIGYVRLDEGPFVLTNFLGVQPGDLRVGLRVKVRFQAAEDGQAVPVFAPVQA